MINSTTKGTFSLKNMYKLWILTGKAGKMVGKSVRIKDFKEGFMCFWRKKRAILLSQQVWLQEILGRTWKLKTRLP